MQQDSDTGADTGSGSGTTTEEKPFEAITTQEALNALIADRVRRAETKGFKSAEEKYKPGHERSEALELELGSAADKAAAEARKDERAKVLNEATPRIVRSEFKAAAKGVLTAEQTKALMEFVDEADPKKYVTDSGDVDEDKIAKRVAAFAPPVTEDKKNPPRPLGQGAQPPTQARPGERGRAEAEKRFGKKA